MGVVRLPPLPTIGDVIRMYGLRARKQLSQNFLLDMNLTRKIVRVAKNIVGGRVCEIGPGPGGITRAILESNVEEVVVIEKDRRFLEGMELLKEASGDRVRIIHADILRFDTETLWPTEVGKAWYDDQPNIHFIGNLPFNVATPLIIQWLHAMSDRRGPFVFGRCGLTLTFQKEVAERIVAPIDGEQRCRLSLICQYLAHVKHKFTMSGSAFVPAPQVDVGVVHFIPREEPLIRLDFKLVEKFCRLLFHFRRKYSIRGIQTLYPKDLDKELAPEVYRRARVNPKKPATQIAIQEVRDMCHIYEEQCTRIKGLYHYNYQKPMTLDELAKLPDPDPPKYKFAYETHTHEQSLAMSS